MRQPNGAEGAEPRGDHALHARAINSTVGNEVGLDERFRAAAGVYARLGAAVSNTLALITHLVREGVLKLDPSVFTERVLAETSVDDLMVGGYSAPAGSIPDIDRHVGANRAGPHFEAGVGRVRGDH